MNRMTYDNWWSPFNARKSRGKWFVFWWDSWCNHLMWCMKPWLVTFTCIFTKLIIHIWDNPLEGWNYFNVEFSNWIELIPTKRKHARNNMVLKVDTSMSNEIFEVHKCYVILVDSLPLWNRLLNSWPTWICTNSKN
jgi:cytochrome c oxidase assembly factor CtaG